MPDDTVLLTGFEPFGGFTLNPSALVAQALDGSAVDNYRIRGVVLPVVFGDAAQRLREAIAETGPAAVICLGLAKNRTEVSVERVAINLDDADIPDNAGNHPVDKPILPEGPPAYWSTLPVKALLAALRDNGISASLSMSAGSYVCNHVFYHLLHHLQELPGTRGGFIHLPEPENLAGTAEDMYLAAMLESARIAIRTLD